jgi:hypothetical protein
MKSKSTVVARVAAQRAAMTSRRRTYNYRVSYTTHFAFSVKSNSSMLEAGVRVHDYEPLYRTVQESLAGSFRKASFVGCALLGILPFRQHTITTPNRWIKETPALLKTKKVELTFADIKPEGVCDGWCGIGSSCASCFPDLQGLKNYGGTE